MNFLLNTRCGGVNTKIVDDSFKKQLIIGNLSKKSFEGIIPFMEVPNKNILRM